MKINIFLLLHRVLTSFSKFWRKKKHKKCWGATNSNTSKRNNNNHQNLSIPCIDGPLGSYFQSDHSVHSALEIWSNDYIQQNFVFISIMIFFIVFIILLLIIRCCKLTAGYLLIHVHILFLLSHLLLRIFVYSLCVFFYEEKKNWKLTSNSNIFNDMSIFSHGNWKRVH